MGALPVATLLLTIALLLIGVVRPRALLRGIGAVFGFVIVVVVPVFVAAMGTSVHVEHSKTVAYCLSCHVMDAHGRSLMIDDPRYLPASHYQEGRVPRETACFACNTTYAMYGDLKAKLHGLRHVWVNYFGTVSYPLKLCEPYNNRECLHCHDGARGFEDTDEHQQHRASIERNELSCLSADCHPKVHAIDELVKLKMWAGPAKVTP